MITLKINSVDKSSLVDWSSLSKIEMLGTNPTTLSFLLKNYPTKTYVPAINDVVELYDDMALIFAGTVSEIDRDVHGLMTTNLITCKDYLGLADSRMVAKSYVNQTGTQIVTDIFTNIISGFTVVNVNCPVVLDKMTFNYLTISQAMQKLMQAVGGGYDWYIDYNKDVHVFQTGNVVAPFALDDVSGNHNYQSLKYKLDFSQLKNKIIVRGASNTGSSVTNDKVADGKQIIFAVGYFLMTSFSAQKALAASPTSFSSLTVGQDGIDNPASFDAMYNPNEGILIFPAASKPAVGDVIKTTGIPSFPIISEVQDPISVAAYGIYEYVIVDRSIASKAIARKKANAELLQYSNPIGSGSFRTQKSGLIAGQVIAINSPIMGIVGAFKIQRVQTTLRGPSATTSDFYFDVEFVSTTNITMTDVLNKLLLIDTSTQIDISANEIIDVIFSSYENISIGESVVASIVHNPENETATVSESFTNNGLNFGTQFVLGPQTPTTTKRQFILSGSALG